MKLVLGMEVGLSSGDFVLDEDPVPFPQKRADPSPIFGPFLLWPNGCMHQNTTWYGAMPRPRRLCVRWRPCPPPPKGHSPLKFSAHICCSKMAASIKMSLGMELGIGPGTLCWMGTQLPSPQKGDGPPKFSAHVYCGQTAGWMKAGTWHGDRPQPRRLCVRWGPSPLPPKGGGAPAQFSAHFYCGHKTAACIKIPLGM